MFGVRSSDASLFFFFCLLKLSIKILRYDLLIGEIMSVEFPRTGEAERLISQRFLLFGEFQKPGVQCDIFQKVKCIYLLPTKDFIFGYYDSTLQQVSNKNLTVNAYLESCVYLAWLLWRWLVWLYPLILWSRELFLQIVETLGQKSSLSLTFHSVCQGLPHCIIPYYKKKIFNTFSE